VVQLDDLRSFDWRALPRDGRPPCWLEPPRALRRRGALAPDLHLVLWNPFQVLDIAAPAS
jgi:beta-N-acetylhexosaminidase